MIFSLTGHLCNLLSVRENKCQYTKKGEDDMAYRKEQVQATKAYAKRFVRYKEGAEMYSIGLTKFQELAKEAHATIKVDKLVLVDCQKFEEFLETFREW